MTFTIRPDVVVCDRCGASTRKGSDVAVRNWKRDHDAECRTRPAGAVRLP